MTAARWPHEPDPLVVDARPLSATLMPHRLPDPPLPTGDRWPVSELPQVAIGEGKAIAAAALVAIATVSLVLFTFGCEHGWFG